MKKEKVVLLASPIFGAATWRVHLDWRVHLGQCEIKSKSAITRRIARSESFDRADHLQLSSILWKYGKKEAIITALLSKQSGRRVSSRNDNNRNRPLRAGRFAPSSPTNDTI